MKNKIKLLATGLVIFLASNSFAQSTNASKIAGVPEPLPAVGSASATKGDLTFFQNMRENNPFLAKQVEQDLRALKARGLSGAELRRALKQDMKQMRITERQEKQKTFLHRLSVNHPGFAKFLANHPNVVAKNGKQIVQHRASFMKRVEARHMAR